VTGLVDTHCHLQLIAEAGDGELAAALESARAAGVDTVVNIGLGEDNAAVVATADQHAGVHATVGWHPHQDLPPSDEQLTEMASLATSDSVVAIGEVGLDYHWRPGYHEVPVEVQKAGFAAMLELARQAGLPVVVHNREAHNDTLEILRAHPDLQVVMHAFSGDVGFARECIEMGIYASVAGPVTYPSAGGLREALEVVPLDHLLVETDAPFLPPQPWRGKPSRPAMVVETARRLAEVKGVALAELTEQLRANTERIFRIPRLSG
jgi:TatD DNase family protein